MTSESKPQREFDLDRAPSRETHDPSLSSPQSVRGLRTRQALTFEALTSVRGMGYASVAALWDAFKPLDRIWEAGPEVIRDLLRAAKNRQADNLSHRIWFDRAALMQRAAEHLDRLDGDRIRVLFRGDPDYPESLNDLESPPRWLYAWGETSLLSRRSKIAVVGTREPSDLGLQSARRTAGLLAEAGYVIVSGLAEGIDTEVHNSVLSVGGETIAVLGNGLLIDFPTGNSRLKRRIVDEGGAVVTEYLPGQTYSRRTFIERNRIQAAISCAVIPIEGARAGGTAHTVRFARELNRLLAGAWIQRPRPTMSNEMFDVLVDHGAAIFDLSEPDGIKEFLEEFKDCSVDVRPPARDGVTSWQRAYGRILDDLRALISARKASEHEIDWLVGMLRRLRDADSKA